MLGKQLGRSFRGIGQKPLHLLIDDPGRFFAELAMLVNLLAEKGMFLSLPKSNRPDNLAHAPMGHHLAGQSGRFLQVVFCAGGILVEEEFLRGAAAQEHRHLRMQPPLADVVSLFVG